MTTRILVELDFICVATLLPPVPVVVFADVVERHFKRVGAHTEVSIRQLFAHRIHICVELEPHIKATGNILHQVVHAPFISRLKRLCPHYRW